MNEPSSQSPPRRRISLARSGLLTAAVLAVALGILGLVWAAHMRGRLHQLRTVQVEPEAAPPPRPGGQEVMHLTRMQSAELMAPEFTAATVLPGVGMQILQTTISLPGRGELPILLGTPEDKLPGMPADAIVGAPFSVLVEKQENGHWTGPHEIVRGRPAEQEHSDVLPDGSAGTAQYSVATTAPTLAPGPQGEGVETTISTILTSRGLEVAITARNITTSPRGVTISWEPRFRAPEGGLSKLSVLPPGGRDAGIESKSSNDAAIALGTQDVNRVFSNLKYSYLSTGPEVRLRNDADGYTLRFTAVTPSIRSLRVQAAKGGNSVLLGFSTAAGEDASESRTTVAPGETLQWRLRIEALPLPGYTSPAE